MSERKAMAMAIAPRYQGAGKADKRRILDELCATTGWHRDHARKALRGARRLTTVEPRRLRPTKYGPEVIAALAFCWSVLGMPAGKRLAPVLTELVSVLRRFGELDVDDDTANLLTGMSAATIDRRLAPERGKQALERRGCVVGGQIPIRTCNEWDNAVPGIVEVRLVPHDGSGPAGEHGWTLTVTDIATGWTEKRSVCGATHKCVPPALDDIASTMPFPILGVDNDSDSEFVDESLSAWCTRRQITATRSRSGNEDDHRHGEQQDRAIVRTLAGHHSHHTAAKILLLNRIWKLQSLLTNYFYPHQRLVSKVHTNAGVSRKYDTATTPHRRAEAHPTVSVEDKAILTDTYTAINPAAVQRRIQALTSELRSLTAGEAGSLPNAHLTRVS